jgi:hypothetical protein
MKFADRLKFTAAGTSAATITFGAAVTGFRTLAQAIADGASDPLAIKVGDTGVPFSIDDGAGNEELSLFTVTSATVLTRTSVLSSSAGGATAATFTGTSLSVFSSMPASFARKLIVATVDASGNTIALTAPNGTAISLGGGSSTSVTPSGDTTGAADLAAIQAALTASGRATLQPGAQYYLNGPIVMPSRSHMSAYGARLKLVAGVFGNIIRNKAVLPSRSVSDASVINPTVNATLTSLTANFVAGDVGNMVGIFGAGAGGAAWYGPIQAITTPSNATTWTASAVKVAGVLGRPTTANGSLYQVTTAGTTGTTEPTWSTTAASTVTDGTVTWTCLGAATGATLNNPALLAVTNAVANVYATTDRDDDITIQGGYWEITENLAGGHLTTSTFQNSFASAFRRVSNLRIKDTTWQTYGPTNQGGRFTISISDFLNVTVDGTYLVSTAGDGVHLTAPGDTALITNTRGTAGDDMVVTNLQDSNTPYIMDTEGSMSNVTVRDLVARNGGSRGFCHYELGSTPTRWNMNNLHLEKLSGVTFNPLVLIQTAINGLTMRGIKGAPSQAGVPLISFLTASGEGSGATIEDVTWDSLLAATSGIIRIADPRGPYRIKNLRFGAASAGTNYGVYLNGALNGSNFGVPILTLDGFYTGNSPSAVYFPSPADATAVYIGFTTASTGGSMINIRDCLNASNTGYVVQKLNPGQINRINISDSQVGGTALAQFPAGDTAITLGLSNVKTFVPIVKTSSPVTVELQNVDISCSTALVQLTGTGATPADIRMSNSRQTSSGALVSRDGTQAIRVRGTDVGVDQTLLTPSDGDTIYNSNATPANGTGVAMYNTAAVKWKNMYSGVTN